MTGKKYSPFSPGFGAACAGPALGKREPMRLFDILRFWLLAAALATGSVTTRITKLPYVLTEADEVFATRVP